jgi:hypothetical protein
VTPVADIGAWAIAHPPATEFVVTTGVQYALQKFRGAFLITDGHHNRVLRVTRTGAISELRAFGNIVPTGLDPWQPDLHGRGRPRPAPAGERQGRAVHALRVKKNGTFVSVVEGLDQPTSVDFIGNTAFVVTLTGKVIRIDNAGKPPFGKSH